MKFSEIAATLSSLGWTYYPNELPLPYFFLEYSTDASVKLFVGYDDTQVFSGGCPELYFYHIDNPFEAKVITDYTGRLPEILANEAEILMEDIRRLALETDG